MTCHRTCPICGTALCADELEGLCRKCLSGLAFGDPLAWPASDAVNASPSGPRQLGDYELLEEIARGGMGVVYKARQKSLKRIVAVKVVLHGPFSSKEFVRRFRTEAEAVAALKHPNIVPVYEVGEEDGHHFFSMEYIEGQDFAELVRDKPMPARRAADYLKTVAEAIDYAHSRGVLHRDLKPSNLLLDMFDQPRVTDFGLAKRLSDSGSSSPNSALTLSGEVLGSPSHIPPEQAAGKFSEASPQSDIYSLGAILYHLVTGRAPFQGETITEILAQVQTVEPIAPKRLNPSVPVDLQTICLKCLEKEPSRRYASARDLAEDLGRFLRNEPILARPVRPWETLWLWRRRHPVTAALSAALLIALGMGVTGVLFEWRRAEQHAQGESRQRLLAEAEVAKTRLNLYVADISLSAQAMQHNNYGLARRTLAALEPEPGQADLRGFEWRYLWNLCRGDQIAMLGSHKWIVTCAAFSPDGRLLATGSQDGTAKLWNILEQKLQATLLASAGGAVWSVAFSPDGKLLITGGTQGTGVWNVQARALVTNYPGQIIALSKTSPWMAVSDSNPLYWEHLGKVTLWDYREGKLLKSFSRPGRVVALSSDARILAAAASPTGIDLWDARSGRLLRQLPTAHPVWSLGFSPDGALLASAGWSSDVLIWDLAMGETARILKGHRLTVWSATFSPDGLTLISTGSDQTIRFWDTSTWQARGTLHGHDSEVWCAAFSPDGKLLATGSKDGAVMLWHAEPPRSTEHLPNKNGQRPVFSPDGRQLLLALPGGAPSRHSFWNLAERRTVDEFSVTNLIGFSPDGKELVSWDPAQRTVEWVSPATHVTTRLPLAGSASSRTQFSTWGLSPEGRVLFAIDQDGIARFWEVATGKLLGMLQGPKPPIRRAILGPGARHFAVSVERDSLVRLYDRPAGAWMARFVCGMRQTENRSPPCRDT